MDVPQNDLRDNVFYSWVLFSKSRSDVFYLPDTKIIPAILKKWGLQMADLEPDLNNKRFEAVRRDLVEYWGGGKGEFIYDPESKTVIVEGVKLSVTKETKTKEKMSLSGVASKVRFVRGWIGSPALTTYLLRVLRKETPNANNPFNALASESPYLPDITYLPELYKILGVSNFDQMNIKGTGDWRSAWSSVTFNQGRFLELHQPGHSLNSIPVLDGNIVESHRKLSLDTRTPIYLMKLPKIVLERLKQRVAHNRGSFPTQSLTKDSFQAVTNNLKGKDLISLCLSNKAFDKFCLANDQELFRRKLKEEFGVDYDENDHGYESPWALYKQMHTYFEFVVLELPSQRDEAATYFVDSSKKRGRKPPHEERLVTLVPPPAEELKNMIGGMWFIIFFPAAPELSFYAVCSMQGEGNRNIVVRAVFETNMIEKTVLKEDIIPNIAQPFMDLYWANNEESFLNSIPAFHDLQATAWYQEMTGDDDVRVLRGYD